MSSAGWTFFQAFLKSPRVVASMIPSSPFLERRLVQAADLANARVAVELGSGTGGTTRALLAAMPRDSRLLAIERTEDFLAQLRAIGDPRLEVIHGCASSVVEELERRGLTGADAVISGIPFSTLPKPLARTIVEQVYQCLSPGGRFVAYQFTDKVAEFSRPVFGAPSVQHELRNVPPLKVFTWQKTAAAATA
jgi:phospholipid N-methyltransferase